MRKFLGLAVIVLAFATSATMAAASAVHVNAACSGCNTFWAQGTGTITENATSGTVWGQATDATLTVRGGSIRVTGARGHWSASKHAMVFQGKVSFIISRQTEMTLTGRVSNFGSTAKGSITLRGTGVYTVGNGSRHQWSRSTHSFALRG
jgi:hypothetical protein